MTSTPIKPVLIGSQVLRPGFMVYEMGLEIQALAKTLAKVHKDKPMRAILAQFPKGVYPLVKEAEIVGSYIEKRTLSEGRKMSKSDSRYSKGFSGHVKIKTKDHVLKTTRHKVKHKDVYIYAVCLNKRSALKRLIKYFQANDKLQ